MEWVVTTGRTIEEATERALDQLGVAADEADIEVVEDAKNGLFGRVRSEAKVRARVRPTEVRAKRDSRRRDRRPNSSNGQRDRGPRKPAANRDSAPRKRQNGNGQRDKQNAGGVDVSNDVPRESIDPARVGEAAIEFLTGLSTAFGVAATVDLQRDDTELELSVNGEDLGLLVGPGGRTLTAVQDLARVAAQRRLGDHDTHLRVDIAGYRERRKASLEAFAKKIANQVRESGKALAIEPMASPDRKVIHDVLANEDGVSTASQGEDPNRRVIVSPA